MVIPIILDTDIGTDVDDAFALVMAALEPELDLRAVTTVYGDTHLRARMARKLLDMLGRKDVPVGIGLARPLIDGKNSYWGGWEGKRFLSETDASMPLQHLDAIQIMVEVLQNSDQPVSIVGIGPLTNLGVLLRDHHEVYPKIKEIICMAGTLEPDDEEWNVQCDPEAAHIIFTSGLPLKLGTRHFVNRPRITQADRARLLSSYQPVLKALVAMFDEFLSYKTRDFSPMYDPVTLSTVFTDRYLPMETRLFKILMQEDILHLMPAGAGGQNTYKIAVPTMVHPNAFIDYLVELLLTLS
jgi:purine nucleosidase